MRLFVDFLPVVMFFIAYKTQGIFVATSVAVAATLALVGYGWLRHRRVERMQLVTLAIVTVLGGFTLAFDDPRFIMWKPTLVNWGFALAFLGSAYVGRKTLVERLVGEKVALPRHVWGRLNSAWVGFFAATGALNLYVAHTFAEEVWVNFKLFGLMGLTVVFVFAQAPFLARHLPQERS